MWNTKHKYFWFLLAILVLFNSTPPLIAQDRASMRYRNLLKLAQGNRANDTSVKSYQVKVTSSQGVPPQKIEMWIETRNGPKFLFVSGEGKVKIPNSTSLYAEDPMVITNQPRGTLNINSTISTEPYQEPKVVGGMIFYKDLFAAMLKMQEQIRKVDPNFGTKDNPQLVLKIQTDKPIAIVRKIGEGDRAVFGRKIMKPNKGFIILAFDQAIAKENPVVEIPGKVSISPTSATPEFIKIIRTAYNIDNAGDDKRVIIPGSQQASD